MATVRNPSLDPAQGRGLYVSIAICSTAPGDDGKGTGSTALIITRSVRGAVILLRRAGCKTQPFFSPVSFFFLFFFFFLPSSRLALANQIRCRESEMEKQHTV